MGSEMCIRDRDGSDGEYVPKGRTKLGSRQKKHETAKPLAPTKLLQLKELLSQKRESLLAAAMLSLVQACPA